MCDAGYTYAADTNACSPCAPGLFKNSTGNFECLPCPVAKYTDVQESIHCLRCQTNTSTSNIGQDSALDCMCGAGYAYNETTASCASCGVDSYKATVSKTNFFQAFS